MKSNLFIPFIKEFRTMEALPDPDLCSICHCGAVATRKIWKKGGPVGYCKHHVPEATEALRIAMRPK